MKLSTGIYFALLLAAFFSGSLYYIGTTELAGDGESYLTLATHIKSGEGSVLYQINNYYPEKGFMFPDCFWFSAYNFILAPFASNTPDFFIASKIITMIIALAALLSFYYITDKLFGRKTALLSSAIMAVNCSFLFFSAIPRVEALFIIFVMFSAMFAIKGFENNKLWIWAGAFGGLAYLTKGTGLLYLGIFFISAFIVNKFKILKNKYFYFYILAFFIIISPMMARNAADYGNPLFHCASSHILWEESIEESKTAYFDNKPTMQTYLKTHSAGDIAGRILRGAFVTTPFKLMKLFELDIFSNILTIKFVSEKLSIITALISTAIMLGALLGFVKSRNKGAKAYIGSLIFVTLCFYIWLAPITSSKKHIFTILPFTAMFFSWTLTAKLKLNEKQIITISGIMLLLSAGFYLSQGIPNPLESYNISPEGYEIIKWMADNTDFSKDVILECNRNYHYNWIYQRKMLFIPVAGNFSELEDHMKTFNVTYAMICSDYQDMKVNKKAFDEKFFYQEPKGLQAKGSIPGWTLVKSDDALPVDYLIYKVNYTG
jgi:hypothetical protein